mmetsp:Transcript_82252/g.266604  ORF Transcript_82252/g.266604 Transcript_82252/m.266604 type:complete len:186 (-) Transcript_82252:374-931(-)
MMLVQTPFMKSSEWDVKSRVFGYLDRYSSSQTQAPRSRWFVGSSSSSSMGSTKSAWARATRMRQPPDMSFVNLFIICSVKPRPWSSSQARASKVSGSILSSLSPMVARRSALPSGSSSRSFMLRASRRSCSLATTSTTAWIAETSSGLASQSRNQMSMWPGMGTSRAARPASIVDLPEPFMPMSP